MSAIRPNKAPVPRAHASAPDEGPVVDAQPLEVQDRRRDGTGRRRRRVRQVRRRGGPDGRSAAAARCCGWAAPTRCSSATPTRTTGTRSRWSQYPSRKAFIEMVDGTGVRAGARAPRVGARADRAHRVHAASADWLGSDMGRKILFITTDQQRYDTLGCNGGTIARTPVVDALAADGIRYERAYNQNTVCMPARSTMLTGQYVRTHGVDRERRAAARRRAERRRVPARARRLPHRAARQGALRARLRPSAASGPRTTCRSAGSSARTAASSTPSSRCTSRRSASARSSTTASGSIDTHASTRREGFSPLLAAEPGGDTGAPETRINPIPRDWYHTDWVADRTIAWLDSLPDDDDWFVWMRFPDPHHPWDPPASELHRCDWRDLDLPPGHPGSHEEIERVLAQKPAHWLALWRRQLRQRRRRPGVVPAAERQRRQGPRDQRDGAHHERADRRGVRPGAATRSTQRGLGRRHRRDLHDRPRRAAGRLRAAVQGAVPRRRADAAAAGVAAGAVGRRRAGRRRASRSARSTSRRRSARSRACPCRSGCRARRCRRRPARVASGCCASGTRSSPATACTCARSTATAGCAPRTSRRRSANRTASRSSSRRRACSAAASARSARSRTTAPKASSTTSTRIRTSGSTSGTTPGYTALRDDLVADLYDNLPAERNVLEGRAARLGPRIGMTRRCAVWVAIAHRLQSSSHRRAGPVA